MRLLPPEELAMAIVAAGSSVWLSFAVLRTTMQLLVAGFGDYLDAEFWAEGDFGLEGDSLILDGL
jgi:hypothetical protein